MYANQLKRRARARWQFTVLSLALGIVAVGCSTLQNAGSGQLMPAPASSMESASPPGSSSETSTTLPPASVEVPAPGSATAVKPVSRADEAAAVLAGRDGVHTKVLGPASAARAASPTPVITNVPSGGAIGSARPGNVSGTSKSVVAAGNATNPTISSGFAPNISTSNNTISPAASTVNVPPATQGLSSSPATAGVPGGSSATTPAAGGATVSSSPNGVSPIIPTTVTAASISSNGPGINPAGQTGGTAPSSTAGSDRSQPFVAGDGTGTVTTSSAPVFSGSSVGTPVAASTNNTPGQFAGSPGVIAQGSPTAAGTAINGTPVNVLVNPSSGTGVNGLATRNPTALTTGSSTAPTISNTVIDTRITAKGASPQEVSGGSTVTRATRTTPRKKSAKKTTARKVAPVAAPPVKVTTDADGNPVVTNVKPATTSTHPPNR